MSLHYDVVVVGAGVNGLSTAWRLLESQQHLRVCVIDQFPCGHSRGSSHGHSRITRYAYPDPVQTRLMKKAFPLWAELESWVGEKLYHPCGLLVGGSESIQSSYRLSLTQNDLPYESLSAGQVAERFPALAGLGSCVFDPNGGLLRADKCMQALRRRVRHLGGDFMFSTTVSSVDSDGVTARVSLSDGRHIIAAQLVLTPGPWAGPFLASLGLQLPLQPLGVTVMYWKEKDPTGDSFGVSKCPVFMYDDHQYHNYGLPALEYPHCPKICNLDGGPIIKHPDLRDVDSTPLPYLPMMNSFVKEKCPRLETPPCIIEKCIYTVTPDKTMILDRHPKWKNIVYCVGCSGSGFKMGPFVGEILSQMVLNITPSESIESFAASRFDSLAKL